jgi:hypothetical protein
MSDIVDIVDDCYSGREKPLTWSYLRYLVIHRTDLHNKTDANPDPVSDKDLGGKRLCEIFKAHPDPSPKGLGTCGLVPYHVLIKMDGTAEQMLPLTRRAAHARSYNSWSLAVAVVGDLTERSMVDVQWQSLLRVCLALAPINKGLSVIGHTDLTNASVDPDKKCPGKYLLTRYLEQLVAENLPFGWLDWTHDDNIHRLTSDGWRIYPEKNFGLPSV